MVTTVPDGSVAANEGAVAVPNFSVFLFLVLLIVVVFCCC